MPNLKFEVYSISTEDEIELLIDIVKAPDAESAMLIVGRARPYAQVQFAETYAQARASVRHFGKMGLRNMPATARQLHETLLGPVPDDEWCSHCDTDVNNCEIDHCSTCGADASNGEGWDGKCGNCADRAERHAAD